MQLIKAVAYSSSITTMIIGIAILLTASSLDTKSVGVAVIVVGFFSFLVFRKSGPVASKPK